MTAAQIADLTRRQLANYDAHTPGIFADAPSSLTITEAYEVQMQMAAMRADRGEQVAGYKIGCVSKAVQRQLGVDRPVFGHLFASEIHRSGVVLDAADFECPAIEGEFAVRLAQDIPSAAWLHEHLEQAIASVFPVIELHNNVFQRCTPTPQAMIINNALHAGVVLAQREAPFCEPAELNKKPIAVFRGEELLGSATSSAIPGGPFASLLEVFEHVSSKGLVLRRDQIVLAGSPLPLYSVGPGDHIRVESPGSGGAELIIATGRVHRS